MSHVHTLKDLETELSFIKDKTLFVTCRTIDDGKQLVFRKAGDSFKDQPREMIYIHNDLRMSTEPRCTSNE